ncbi:MAG: signal peptidase I [Chthoniobacteraceae bacterium]
MFFITPRYVKHGNQFARDARKLLAYKRDLVSQETIGEVEDEILALEAAVKSRDKSAVESRAQRLDKVCGKLTKPQTDSGWRENVEVFLVAIIIALAVRTYFIQPFTIPTGSMQPTLNGIIGTPMTEPPPNILVRAFQGIAFGRTYVNVVAKSDETIAKVNEFKSLLPFVDRTPILSNVGFFARTELITSAGNRYVIKETADPLLKDLLKGNTFRAGEPIVRGYFDTGDHVFVDKFTYHFRKPDRGEVFVFNTMGLPTPEYRRNPQNPSQFYIKRLVGVPGDKLRIDPPVLHVNGQPAQEETIKRVASGTPEAPTNGYRGYANGFPGFTYPILRTPGDVFEVPAKSYFAMGDNSFHSSDSRDWGAVPQKNLMGRGVFVYWPFDSHWGRIK